MKKSILSVFLYLLFQSLSYSQAPGGVTGTKLWLEASTYNSNAAFNPTSNFSAAYFNFNPVLDLKQSRKKFFKGVLEKEHSLFVVFKSDIDDERSVINVTKGKSDIMVTNKALLNDGEIAYTKVNSKSGIILSYFSSAIDKGRKNNKIVIDNFFGEGDDGSEQLLELIYYPRILNSLEKQKVETYLSIKYGLSLLGEADYIISSGKKIWKYKENKGFGRNITGIGRDDSGTLLQKQSGNAKKDGLYIGFGVVDTLNTHNKYYVEDQTFLLWGDNGGDSILLQDKKIKDIKAMARIWKMRPYVQVNTDSLITQVRLDKRQMGIAPEKERHAQSLWLAINDSTGTKFSYTGARYIKQSKEDSTFIYFDNVVWDIEHNGSDLFTLIQAPDLFIVCEGAETCDAEGQGILKLGIIGGAAPYNLDIVSGNFSSSIPTEDIRHEITNLRPGEYSVKVTDRNGNTAEGTAVIDPFTQTGIVLPETFILDKKEIRVAPSAKGDQDLSYEWKNATRVISTESDLLVDEPGDYTLVVTTEQGCQKEFPFRVIPGSLYSGWQVYPNPSKKGEEFFIRFSLKELSQASVSINSVEGKEIMKKDLGKIQQFEFKYAITTSGVYLVTVTINNRPETVKLIID